MLLTRLQDGPSPLGWTAGHLGERDAAPTGLELFGQSPAFSPPITPLSQYLTLAGLVPISSSS